MRGEWVRQVVVYFDRDVSVCTVRMSLVILVGRSMFISILIINLVCQTWSNAFWTSIRTAENIWLERRCREKWGRPQGVYLEQLWEKWDGINLWICDPCQDREIQVFMRRERMENMVLGRCFSVILLMEWLTGILDVLGGQRWL